MKKIVAEGKLGDNGRQRRMARRWIDRVKMIGHNCSSSVLTEEGEVSQLMAQWGHGTE